MKLEFWFDFASTYSYLSVMRIEALAQESGVHLVWRPFLLGPLFRAFGWTTSPFLLQKEKGAYMWRDIERQCRKFGLAWRQPGEFPRRSLLGARVALLGLDEPWLAPFARRVMLANFSEDLDIGSEAVVRRILEQLQLPAEELIVAAGSEANKLELREATEEARRRGVFGAPTYFAGTDMFWGNDRLDDAIACARADASAAAR
jgi:2-hydroxychromene-2-carboxylate isomerase